MILMIPLPPWHIDGVFFPTRHPDRVLGKDRSPEENDMVFVARKKRGLGTDMRWGKKGQEPPGSQSSSLAPPLSQFSIK